MATLNGVHYSNTSGLNLKTNGTTQVNISTGGVIEFNQAYTFPTSDGSANNVLLTDGAGSLSFGTVPNAGLTNSSLTVTAGSGLANGGSVSLGSSVTLNVGAGTGIVVNANDVALDYAGTNNFIDSATNLEGTSIAGGDTIVYHDATDNNVKKGFVSDLPFSNNSGTVTSVAISGSDGIDVDSGSPITTSGTIALGLSNIPNSSLANSSVTVGTTAISLGSSSTTLAGLTSVTSTAFVGDLTGDVNGNASTADTWANSRTLTLGTDLSGNVSFNGSANFTLNASIVSGAVGSTELATNAVTTTKITDGNVTNAKLANSSFTVNAPSGSDPVVPLGGTLNFTSSDSSVTIAGNSTTDTIDLIVAGSVNTYVTGGTFTSGTLSLGLNDGSSAQDITGLWSSIPNSALANSSVTVTAGSGLVNGGSVSLGGSVTLNVGAGTGISVAADTVGLDTSNTRNVDHGSVSISAGTGLSGGGTIASSRTISLDYAGTDNFIDSASNKEGTAIATSDTIIYHDATDNNVYKGLVSDLPFSNTSGTVTSVAITGTDGIDVDSGSPITSSGTITLGLSSVPNSSLANSSVTVTAGNGLVNGGSVSLGSSVTLNVAGGTGILANANDVSLDYAGTDNYILAAGAGTGDITTSMYIPVSDASNNVKKYTVNALPFTNNQGTVTSVAISGSDGIDVDSGSPITTNGTIALGLSNVPNTSLANSSVTVTGGNGLTGGGAVSLGSSITLNVGAGTLIDVDGSNVNVDLSELTTSTSNGDGDYFVVVDTANAQKKLTKGNINISGFNNDAGYITSAGNTNIYGSNGSLTSTRTVTQNGNNLRFLGDASNSRTEFAANNSLSWPGAPRVLAHADDNYTGAIETWTEGGAQMHIRSYDQGQNPVFFVDAQGNLVATSKAFDIPHPNPEKKEQGMRLKHGNLEGPEHGVYVRGRQIDDKEIELPEYWRDLVDPDSITVQLTSVGSHQNLYVKKIEDNVVYIGNGNLFSNKIDCYYFIQAERKDIDKVQVEYIRE